jgi:hypothetical protein
LPLAQYKTEVQVIMALVTRRARPSKPDFILEDVWEMLQRCWAEDPEERPCIEAVWKELEGRDFVLEKEMRLWIL